nr:6K2 protein [Lily mottle virus]
TLESMAQHLQLKGHWNKSLLTHDVVICGAVLLGCVLMVGSYFKERCSGVVKRYNENVKFQ